MNVKPQIFGFVVAVVVVAGLVGWAGYSAWQELRLLWRNFGTVQTESFHLAERILTTVAELNEAVQRFDLHKNPADRTAFEKMGEELKLWLKTQKGFVTTALEVDLLHQIEGAFEQYLTRTRDLFQAEGQTDSGAPPRPLLERLDERDAQLLALTGKLKVAEREALNQFVMQSHRSVEVLQWLLAASVMLLVILGFTATRLIYRARIAPLRAQVIQSRARAARHEKLASLGTLAAGVAHEIRNPLTAINVRLHSLKKSLAANSSEQEDALVIGHEIQRLERIVQEFLQFARPTEPRLHTVSADSLLARMQSLFGPQLEKTSIRLNLESVPDLWVRVDPHQMEQVLINLIQNAAESMEGGGTITLRSRTGRERLAGRTRPVVIIEVSDTGKGIPPEVRKRMFDPFFTTKEEGTGLGLAISCRILEKHGGALECRDDVNRGTTFAILLPHSEPVASHEPAAQNSAD